MDLISFIATLFAMFTNPLGIMDAAASGMNAARQGADLAQLQFRMWAACRMARPMRSFVWSSCAFLMVAVGVVAGLHYGLLTEAEMQRGRFGLLLAVSAIVIAAAAFEAWLQARFIIGRSEADDAPPEIADDPVRVHFIRCVILLIVAVMVVSIMTSLHALFVGSSALWLVAMVVRYVGLAIIATALIAVAWVVRRAGGAFEKALQVLIEIAAPLAPGITYDNVRARLFPNGLNLYEEEMVAAKIAGVTSAFALVLLPFDLVVLAFPTVEVAVVFGGAYLIKVFAAWVAKKTGNEELVKASTKRLSGILYVYLPWLAALSFGVLRFIQLAMPAIYQSGYVWFWRLLHGDVQLVSEHPWYVNVTCLVIGGILLSGFIGAAEKVKTKKAKVALIAPPALFCLNFLGSFLMNLGVWDGRPPVVEAKTKDEIVTVTDETGKESAPTWRTAAQDASVPENSIKLDWQTDKKADCQVEITAIRHAVDKEYAHKAYKVGSRLQALATDNGKRQHTVMLDDLAPGVTVVYRIHATRLEKAFDENGNRREDFTGLTTVTREFNASIPLTQSTPNVAASTDKGDDSKPNGSPVNRTKRKAGKSTTKPRAHFVPTEEERERSMRDLDRAFAGDL